MPCDNMPPKVKLIPCTHVHCGGRMYEGLGYYNPNYQAEFLHDADYGVSDGDGTGRAYFLESGSIYPGQKYRAPIINHDALH